MIDAQGQKPDPGRARKHFDKARLAFEAGDHASAQKDLDAALKADSIFADALILYGDLMLETNRPGEAVTYYRKSLRFQPSAPAVVWNLLGNTLYSLERYAEACPCYDSVLAVKTIRPDLRDAIGSKLSVCLVRRDLMENPVEFQPKNLGKGVNTVNDEYINTLSADGNELYFTRREPSDEIEGKEFKENFYYSGRHKGTWDTAVLLGYPEGTENDAGALCISPDGNLLVFTACFRKGNSGSCDLYYSEKRGGMWSEAKNMGTHINSDLWDAQPSISPDGKTIYFASNRKGGYGSSDIWATRRLPTGNWSKPYNLGPVINSVEAEMAPYIHFDNNTLYFSSKGHPGLGGADLFRSVRSGTSWSTPVNLGFPINTSSDELVVIVNADGETGFISSNILEGEGAYDIYSFALFDEIRPNPVTYLKGIVFDEDDRKPLQASFELYDLEADSLILSASSDPSGGEFLVCLPVGKNYALNVSCEGYLFYSDHFPLQQVMSRTDPFIRNIPLKKVREGNVMVLNNIFFEFDRYELQPASYPELEKLTEFLRENPGLNVEISGHTDDTGTEQYNLDLSAKRAEAVVHYLASRDVDRSRMTFRGYGETRPVESNETEAGKAKNRRTEVRITGIN
jgi:flagellar motor protein MotB